MIARLVADAGEHRGGSTGGVPSVGPSWGTVAPLLGALGTSVGLIGFVVFFGGAILWTQADAVGLPASEVVALVPRTVLLSTGAHFLVAALLLALFGVGVLWVYDVVLRDRLLRKQEEEERISEEPRAALQQSLDDALQRHAAAVEAVKLATSAHMGALQAAAAAPDSSVFSAAVEEEQRRRAATERELTSAADELKRVEHDFREHMPRLERKAKAAREKRESRENWTRLTLLGLVFLGIEMLFTNFAPIAWYDYVIVVALSGATIAVSLVIYAETKRFVWFAISAFVAIGLYIGFVTYFRTHDSAQAEPAAALIDGRVPVEGYFIAQTSDRVYFGIPESVSQPARMIALRRDDVVALAIGKLTVTKKDKAFHVARELGAELCEDLSAGQPKRADTAAAMDSRPLCPSASAGAPKAHLALTRSVSPSRGTSG
ncbi:MAG: hypothetical protein ACTHM1_12920 [Solirubrobacteraceae bacterium]